MPPTLIKHCHRSKNFPESFHPNWRNKSRVIQFVKHSLFRNIRQQTNESGAQYGFTYGSLPLCTIPRLAAWQHVPLAINHRSQSLQVFIVNIDRVRRLAVWGESTAQLLLETLPLFSDLFDFGFVVWSHILTHLFWRLR